MARANVLPAALTVLGELGEVVIYLPDRRAYYCQPYKPGSILCANASGRELFVVRPIRDAGPIKRTTRAVHAAGLYERFQHRKADAFYNCFVPDFDRPQYRGQLAVLHYLTPKGPGGRLTEWVHFFEKPGDRPAYVDWYSVGHGQFWVPRGEFHVVEAGIEYARRTR